MRDDSLAAAAWDADGAESIGRGSPRDLPAALRPREKLFARGPAALTQGELLALILGTGTRSEPVTRIARRLVRRHGLEGLRRLSTRDWCAERGLGRVSAARLCAAFELGRRSYGQDRDHRPRISSPGEAYRQVRPLVRARKEHLVGLYLDAQNSLIHQETISIGSLNTTRTHPREILHPALLHMALGFILVHNHPRGCLALHCPEQYRLYYIENLRPRVPSANLVFGQVVHQAIAHLFQTGGDPVESFLKSWNAAREVQLDYGRRDSWEKLNDAGQALLSKFMDEALPRLDNIRAAERRFELSITTLNLPFIGVIDLVADLDGKPTVIDFKTAASSYGEHEAALSDQLTAYQLAEPQAEQAALCVLVKTKKPRIEWHATTRRPGQLSEYLSKAGFVSRDIAAGRFYKRPGMWCSWCDYLPVCVGDTKKVAETLIQIR